MNQMRCTNLKRKKEREREKTEKRKMNKLRFSL